MRAAGVRLQKRRRRHCDAHNLARTTSLPTMPWSPCAAGWAPVGPQLRLPHIKFVYPTAPTRPITVNMGMKMPGCVLSVCMLLLPRFGQCGGAAARAAAEGAARPLLASRIVADPTAACPTAARSAAAGLTFPT